MIRVYCKAEAFILSAERGQLSEEKRLSAKKIKI